MRKIIIAIVAIFLLSNSPYWTQIEVRVFSCILGNDPSIHFSSLWSGLNLLLEPFGLETVCQTFELLLPQLDLVL